MLKAFNEWTDYIFKGKLQKNLIRFDGRPPFAKTSTYGEYSFCYSYVLQHDLSFSENIGTSIIRTINIYPSVRIEDTTGNSEEITVEHIDTQSSSDSISVELSSRRTGMSFQRTRLSADRTLMSVIRTALSLISFGFTIFQVFQKLRDIGTLAHAAAPRNFGIALVLLGIFMLVVGIIYHIFFMAGLRQERDAMRAENLIHAESRYPVSFTLITAVILLLIGLVAISSMVFNVGPFTDATGG